MQELEAESQRRETQVSQMRLDASSSDGIKQLKGKTIGLLNRTLTGFYFRMQRDHGLPNAKNIVIKCKNMQNTKDFGAVYRFYSLPNLKSWSILASPS